jgi:hypothetical protein
MKIRPMGAELFHADRQAGMTKLVVTFYNFANAPKESETSAILSYVSLLNDFL